MVSWHHVHSFSVASALLLSDVSTWHNVDTAYRFHRIRSSVAYLFLENRVRVKLGSFCGWHQHATTPYSNLSTENMLPSSSFTSGGPEFECNSSP